MEEERWLSAANKAVIEKPNAVYIKAKFVAPTLIRNEVQWTFFCNEAEKKRLQIKSPSRLH